MTARVLLVEDERLIGTMVRINLERDGHEVEWIADGGAASAAVKAGRYDLLIMDLMLPGKDGMTLIAEARAAGVTAPVLILTALSAVEAKVKGLATGADDYLTKPFDLAELRARVAALMRRKG